MLNRRFEWTILLFLAALLGGAWIVVSREPTVTSASTSLTLTEAPIVGHRAPDFTLSTPLDEAIALAELAGQPVVLNFWASWCAPCRVEMPSLQQASVQYNGRAAFIGINQGEAPKTVTDFGTEYGVTYPLLVDAAAEISQLYNVRGLPTTLFIDAKGVVREVVVGPVSQAVLEDRVESLLAEGQ